ncbi:hypothetical protein VNI00_015270 [Paramarasmius palmivorus]|uniref:Uncharacterized protein n=1 Tax=Paramarasmius palmivorus TaxID=297713 RepID=A0AAW0BM93_9AGAR
MATVSLDVIQDMAVASNPAVLVHVGSMLGVAHPTRDTAPSDVLSICGQLVTALDVLAVYLRSRSGHLPVNFPGMDEMGSWKLLRRTFTVLELWSPLSGGGIERPPLMSAPGWLNDVVHAVFGVLYALVDDHGDSELCSLLMRSRYTVPFCSRVFYGALAVDGSVLRPIVAVMVHPCWPDGAFRNVRSKSILENMIQQRSIVDLPGDTILRFIHLLRPRTVLQDAPELHAVVVGIMHLTDVATPRFMVLHLPRWLSNCASYVMKRLRRVSGGGSAASQEFDADAVGLLLLLCIEYLTSVGQARSSSGWVLEGVEGGLLRAVLDVGAYISAEDAVAEGVYAGRHGEQLSTACDAYLRSLFPHLLSVPVLVRIKQVLNGRGPHDPSQPPAWDSWSDIVTQVYEYYCGYKVSEYRLLTKWTCSNDAEFVSVRRIWRIGIGGCEVWDWWWGVLFLFSLSEAADSVL